MTDCRFTSAALSELRQATLYYEEQENGLGVIFLDEIDAAVERILANPQAWDPLPPRTRRCRTHRFPFGLLYQVRRDEILITAVMDLRRDPTRWEDLLRPDIRADGMKLEFVGCSITTNRRLMREPPRKFDPLSKTRRWKCRLPSFPLCES